MPGAVSAYKLFYARPQLLWVYVTNGLLFSKPPAWI